MEALGISGGLIGQWRPEHWLLAVEVGLLLVMMLVNARATLLLGASELSRSRKRIWLAMIWGLPFAGAVFLLTRILNGAPCRQVESTR